MADQEEPSSVIRKQVFSARTSPIRAIGEAEARMPTLTGANADFDGNYLSGFESREAIKTINEPLFGKPLVDGAEYFNRKLKLLDSEGAPEQKVAKVLDDLKSFEADQARIKAALERGKFRDQAARKQELMAAGLSEDEAERLKVYSATELRNLVLSRMVGSKGNPLIGRSNEGWLKETLEETPPPPITEFSTGDLEQPQRFIIKNLEGFEFNPDTAFDGLRLPYESCLFVLGTELKAVVLATQEADDVISLKLLTEQKGDVPWTTVATLYARLRHGKAKTRWSNTKRALDKRYGMVSAVLAFIAAEQLSEVEIETVITAPEHDVPPPKPGNCYNVVHLTQGRKGKRRDWQGGTHASPREHKRRGFWWPGRHGPIWIKPTIVNKGVLGRVDKEYHVTKIEE